MVQFLVITALLLVDVVFIRYAVRHFRNEQALAGRLGPSERERVLTRRTRQMVHDAEQVLRRNER
jgi:hypothetical protein